MNLEDAMPYKLTLPQRIEKVIRDWPQWSRAERRRMDELVEEILTYCRSGKGNAFVQSWFDTVLTPALEREPFTVR